jgi:hypothetical protein
MLPYWSTSITFIHPVGLIGSLETCGLPKGAGSSVVREDSEDIAQRPGGPKGGEG